jgi:hypothetical protein
MKQIYHNTRRRIHRTNRILEALAVNLAVFAVLIVAITVVYLWLTGPTPNKQKPPVIRQAGRRI